MRDYCYEYNYSRIRHRFIEDRCFEYLQDYDSVSIYVSADTVTSIYDDYDSSKIYFGVPKNGYNYSCSNISFVSQYRNIKNIRTQDFVHEQLELPEKYLNKSPIYLMDFNSLNSFFENNDFIFANAENCVVFVCKKRDKLMQINYDIFVLEV